MRAIRINCVVATKILQPYTQRYGNRCNWERFVQQKGNQYVINLPVQLKFTHHVIFVMSIFAHSVQNPYTQSGWLYHIHVRARARVQSYTPLCTSGHCMTKTEHLARPFTTICYCWMFLSMCERARVRVQCTQNILQFSMVNVNSVNCCLWSSVHPSCVVLFYVLRSECAYKCWFSIEWFQWIE